MESSKDSDVCPICKGDEWVFREDVDGIGCARECECRKRKTTERLLRFANIPEAFGGMDLQTFRTDIYKKPESLNVIKATCKIIKEYLANFNDYHAMGKGLYIYSNKKGSGKTRMAASIANELMVKRGKQVKFATSTTILNEIKRTWDKGNEYTENRLLDHLVTTDILIIDDFGAETVKDWIEDRFYYVINERYTNKKVTIFTTNESLQTFGYGERIASRVMQMTYQVAFPEEGVREYIAREDNLKMMQRIKMG